jgi:hypothetical protein
MKYSVCIIRRNALGMLNCITGDRYVCTANNFAFLYSQQRLNKNSFPQVHLYISKDIYDIPARTTSCCCQALDEFNPKRMYDNKYDACAYRIEPGLPTMSM